jgi:hypothetical protein
VVLNNENTIKKINCNVLLESYVDQVNTDLFKEWHKKIVDDFSAVKDFKRLITQEAELFVSKGKGSFDECLNFLLEEYGYTCTFLKNRNIICPMPFSKTMVNLIERYNLNIIDLPYALSNYARKHSNESYMREIVNEGIISLLKISDLRINFFVINKNGR